MAYFATEKTNITIKIYYDYNVYYEEYHILLCGENVNN